MLASRTTRALLLSVLPLLFARAALADALGANSTTPDLGPWISAEESHAVDGVLANIHPAGTAAGIVVASPSRSNPDYWYHWTRDSALTMGALLDRATASSDDGERAQYFSLLADYVTMTRKMQQEDTQSGRVADHFANIGEPKFEVDGSDFSGQWGRPQDDGPALRVITLTRFLAAAFDADGNPAPGVTGLPQGLAAEIQTAITADLTYLVYHGDETSYDLWEETRGHHFYTGLVQRRALLLGADAATKRGDAQAAQTYTQKAAALAQSLGQHWDQGRGYLVETLDRDGGISYKSSNLDAGVILGVLHADGPNPLFAPNDDRVLATAEKLRTTFAQLYPIDHTLHDTSGRSLAPGIGRYPEDVYDGANNQGGNPWALITLGMAELDYRVAHKLQQDGEVKVTARSAGYYQRLLGSKRAKVGETIRDSDPRFAQLVQAVTDDGDAYLARVRYHTPTDLSLWEQMDRNTGFMRSARDLTWSYASFLTTISQRDQLAGN